MFDPILNYDTKVFVEPLLLKNSTGKIIQQSYQTYKEFFAALLLLLKNSKNIGDKCWRAAQKMVHFPEYQYTCIGYSSGNTEGRGSGIEFNDKIFQSAVEALCLEELHKNIYVSAAQLCQVVANRIMSEFPQLLDSFQPYKNHSMDGRDWTSPTFYRWCNEAYTTFNNKSELPVE